MKNLGSKLLLVLAAFIWGAAFSAQSVGTQYLGPFSFNGIRFLIGGVALLLLCIITDVCSGKQKRTEGKALRKKNIGAGILCGIVLCIAASFQQYGISYVTPGQSGFITALYVILVPIIGVFLGKKGTAKTWLCAGLAIVGMYFLCLFGANGAEESVTQLQLFGRFTVNARWFGYGIEFLCAIAFAFHILVIDKYSPGCNGVKVSCVQFLTAGVLCMLAAVIFEKISFQSVWDCIFPLLYTGVCSCGIGYTLQIVGQKRTKPATASLLMSLESVFSALTAWMFLKIRMSGAEIIGCAIVFSAIVISQLPGKEA